MNFLQMQYVLEIARQKSFSKAAAALFVSQPTLSYQVKNLEDELQVRLFYRSTREVFLTKAGVEFCHHASKIMDEFQALHTTMEKYISTDAPSLSIGYIPSFSCCKPFQSILGYLKSHPEINTRFVVNIPEILLDDLHSGILDIIFTDFPEILNMENSPELNSYLLVNERCYLLTSKDHPLQQRESISFAELEDIDIIGIPKGHMVDKQAQLLLKYNSSFMQGKLQTLDMNTRIALVKNDMGAIFGPKYLADYYNLSALPIEPPKYGSGIHMVTLRHGSSNAALQPFIDYIIAENV